MNCAGSNIQDWVKDKTIKVYACQKGVKHECKHYLTSNSEPFNDPAPNFSDMFGMICDYFEPVNKE